MSGSYDRNGVPFPPVGRDPLGYDRRTGDAAGGEISHVEPDPLTGPPTGLPTLDVTHPPQTHDFDVAPAIERDPDLGSGSAPIVPAQSVTGGSLTMVIAIMCFLACLTAGAVYLMNQSADAWLRNIASEVTVQIEPRRNMETTIQDVASFLAVQPGVVSISNISEEVSRELLQPWLGSSEALSALQVPRLMAVQVDRNAPPDMGRIRANLEQRFPGVTLDDHRQWQEQIRTITRTFALGGLAILLLVGAATTAVIISATRSAMLSNREIVEVLHFVGATDRFIAREFERHFLSLGIKAGLVGAFCAAAVFLAMPIVMEVLGSGSMALAEVRRLIGAGSLDGVGFLMLGLVVVVISALCMLTSRFGVYRILNSR